MTMKKNSKLKGFSIHIMPYSEIRELTITERVKKILQLVLGNRVVILQGKLRPEKSADRERVGRRHPARVDQATQGL